MAQKEFWEVVPKEHFYCFFRHFPFRPSMQKLANFATLRFDFKSSDEEDATF